jgi:hypothetical protein
MELQSIHNPFEYRDYFYGTFTADEVRKIQHEIALVLICLPDIKLEALDDLLDCIQQVL